MALEEIAARKLKEGDSIASSRFGPGQVLEAKVTASDEVKIKMLVIRGAEHNGFIPANEMVTVEYPDDSTS